MLYKNKILAIIIIIVSMLLLIISLYFIIKNTLEFKENNELVEKLIDDVIEEKEVAEENTEDDFLSIDWKKLKNINEDIIGWIKIKDTNINYPILKSKDLYYLKHSYNKQWNSNGSIFVLAEKPFEENKTIVYGHNMRNETMFSQLGKYLDKDFFNTHKSFELYTQEKKYKATVFSCYSIGLSEEENNIKNLEFEEEIQYYKDKSKFPEKDIGKIKKIVKLSTCSYLENKRIPTEKRYFIIAKIEEI